jgi:uncharacterized protein with HEPN domain
MSLAGLYLYDIGKLGETLTGEFGSLPYEKFSADTAKVDSAVRRLVIMRERWSWLRPEVQKELVPIDWRAVTGTWDGKAARYEGVDSKQLWETIVQKLPEVNKKVEELLKSQG